MIVKNSIRNVEEQRIILSKLECHKGLRANRRIIFDICSYLFVLSCL